MRPSKIPTTEGQFGDNGEAILSVRQTKFGIRAAAPAGSHNLTGQFEFDLFGVGENAGETTFRLRQAWAAWGPVLVGQTNSLFMDADLFPNVIDYWGPTGMVFVRNPQIRLTVVDTADFKLAFAIETPNEDIDVGNIRQIDPDLAANLRDVTPLPDLTVQARHVADWGHVQLSGLLTKLGYETIGTADNRPKGNRIGWGVNLGTSFNLAKATTLRAGVVYGHGIASFMNDGGTDLAPATVPLGPGLAVGLEAEAVPLLGIIAYVDHRWSRSFTSALGYSVTQVENTNFQTAAAFHKGEYASGNLLWEPTGNIMVGGELLYGRRTDNGGATGYDIRTQLTVRASFSSKDLLKKK